MFLGLRSVIYPSTDLQADKTWWSTVLGVQPYFDEPFYVGFSVEGFELGLDPNASQENKGEPIAYWGVQNMEEAVRSIVATGATVQADVQEVGGGIKMAVVITPSGEKVGLIENPHFGMEND